MTENDTFRSNQIRAGVMTRERALDLIDRDNRPRLPSIDWYLRTIGMDGRLEEVLATIARAPTLWSGLVRGHHHAPAEPAQAGHGAERPVQTYQAAGDARDR
jgi:hypothetical protein